uniref:Dolichyl-diphosphooligosaccharide--protein glycosyltransferase subunit KCP2 n=1 Tax=Panagrolaimus davidi TaxID=227884 RepID=A0A914P2H1_9BILA
MFLWKTEELGQLVVFDFLIDCMEICAIFSNGAINYCYLFNECNGTNHSFSGVAFALSLLTITAGQTFKTYLAGSLQGTSVAGILGSFVFLFMLTAMSNFKMSSASSHVKSGLTEVLIALLIGIVASASIHRVSVTICLLASGVLLYHATFVSHERYNVTKPAATTANKKK